MLEKIQALRLELMELLASIPHPLLGSCRLSWSLPQGILGNGRASKAFLPARAAKPIEGRDALGAQTHPVQDVSPPLHGDTLVHGEHREAKVVKVSDAMVGSWPASSALTTVDGAGAPGASSSTG